MNMEEIGIVRSVRGFLVFIEGLPTIRINDMVESNGAAGLVNGLMDDWVSVLMLSDAPVKPGQVFNRLEKPLAIGIGDFLLGRIIDPLGAPIDGKRIFPKTPALSEIEKKAPGVWARQFIKDQFTTGISLVDMLLPIGKGQRQLILGDARSGKTSFLIDLMINQQKTGAVSIYASIGKAITDVKKLADVLSANKALESTIIVAATSSAPPPLIFLAPKTAFTIAEYFQRKGRDVLLILDDLGNHAKVYREMSLLEGRSPGRESYPGDIFYQHARLLERAGNFTKEEGGGSITALPVVELNLTDFTTYIPTNLMAMTDGHLLFESALYNQGQRPAINISLSVTRVGLQTQHRVQNAIAGKIKSVLTQATQLESLSRFSTELPAETQQLLHQKELIDEIIQQDPFTFISKVAQTLLMALVFTSFLEDKDKYFVGVYKKTLIEAFTTNPRLKELSASIPMMKDEKELLEKLAMLRPTLEDICSRSSK